LYAENLAWLAKLLNVAVKLTGCPSYAGDAYPFKSLPPLRDVRHLSGHRHHQDALLVE
jgi:hypothetical protein